MEEQKLIGLSRSDGTHWFYREKEVAVIQPDTGDIEWCVRTFTLPEDVVKAVRSKRPKAYGRWVIEARRVDQSATQGFIKIFVNGEDTGIGFGDRKELNKDGEWESTIRDEDLGNLVYACLWHKYDAIYHYSDYFKKLFSSAWSQEKSDEYFAEKLHVLSMDEAGKKLREHFPGMTDEEILKHCDSVSMDTLLIQIAENYEQKVRKLLDGIWDGVIGEAGGN